MPPHLVVSLRRSTVVAPARAAVPPDAGGGRGRAAVGTTAALILILLILQPRPILQLLLPKQLLLQRPCRVLCGIACTAACTTGALCVPRLLDAPVLQRRPLPADACARAMGGVAVEGEVDEEQAYMLPTHDHRIRTINSPQTFQKNTTIITAPVASSSSS